MSVVRAANTGVSAFVSHQGRVLATAKDAKGEETFVMGQKTWDLPIGVDPTLFRRGGYLFPYFSAGLFLILIMIRSRGWAKV